MEPNIINLELIELLLVIGIFFLGEWAFIQHHPPLTRKGIFIIFALCVLSALVGITFFFGTHLGFAMAFSGSLLAYMSGLILWHPRYRNTIGKENNNADRSK